MDEQGWEFYHLESLLIHSIPRQRMGLSDMTFIQMKYVAATVVYMLRLQLLVEYSAMGNPNLIHSLTACMKGGFSIMLEKNKAD